MISFKVISDNIFGTFTLSNHPETCPECHNKTTPNFIAHKSSKQKGIVYVFLNCPSSQCDTTYSTEYRLHESKIFYFNKIVTGSILKEKFSNEISGLSTSFVNIYNESYYAEQNNLLEICGVGFRKALEFLIKDYLILKYPEKGAEIKKSLLGRCISTYVEDNRIKQSAKRAVWLGNDHTHYVKKWEEKELKDLKLLIKLTVNWIESEIMTEKFITEME